MRKRQMNVVVADVTTTVLVVVGRTTLMEESLHVRGRSAPGASAPEAGADETLGGKGMIE